MMQLPYLISSPKQIFLLIMQKLLRFTNVLKKKMQSMTYQELLQFIVDKYVAKNYQQYKEFKSRSALSLAEIQYMHPVIFPNYNIIDIGSAPGGWTDLSIQFAQSKPNKPTILSVDIQYMAHLDGSIFFKGDILDIDVQQQILKHFKLNKVDLILSDISSEFMGDLIEDNSEMVSINVNLIKFIDKILRIGGSAILRGVEGYLQDQQQQMFQQLFTYCQKFKPSHFRQNSPLFYYVCKGFKLSKSYSIYSQFLNQLVKHCNQQSGENSLDQVFAKYKGKIDIHKFVIMALEEQIQKRGGIPGSITQDKLIKMFKNSEIQHLLSYVNLSDLKNSFNNQSPELIKYKQKLTKKENVLPKNMQQLQQLLNYVGNKLNKKQNKDVLKKGDVLQEQKDNKFQKILRNFKKLYHRDDWMNQKEDLHGSKMSEDEMKNLIEQVKQFKQYLLKFKQEIDEDPNMKWQNHPLMRQKMKMFDKEEEELRTNKGHKKNTKSN